MLRKTLAAETTVTEEEHGQFEAVVSAWAADREGDVIERSAFDRTIRDWRSSGKNLPLLFEHGPEVVGRIDPATMKATDAGLVAAGEIDRETDRGPAAWRSIKSGVAGFSIGYMADSRPRKGGGRVLTRVDLLEVSITSTPMHPATRATSWKSMTVADDIGLPTNAEIAERALRREVAALAGTRRKASRPVRVEEFPC